VAVIGLLSFTLCANVYTSVYSTEPIYVQGGGLNGRNESFAIGIPKPSGPFALTVIQFSLVDGAGNQYPREVAYLHHSVFFDVGVPDLLCGGNMNRFMASGGEFTTLTFPDSYALLFGASSVWAISWDVVNWGSVPIYAYVQYTLTYTPLIFGFIPLYNAWLDEGYCDDSSYNVPPGYSIAVRKAAFFAPQNFSAMIVYTVGHLHPGGVSLTVTNQTDYQICKSVPTYSSDGKWITDMSSCTPYLYVDDTQVFFMQSLYQQNPTSQLQGVMGIMLSYICLGSCTPFTPQK